MASARDRLFTRLWFTASMLIALTVTMAVIVGVVAVAGHHQPARRLVVVPAATASPAP